MFGFGKKKEETAVVVSNPEPVVVVEEVKKPTVMRKKEFGKMEYEVLIGKNTAINGNINIVAVIIRFTCCIFFSTSNCHAEHANNKYKCNNLFSHYFLPTFFFFNKTPDITIDVTKTANGTTSTTTFQ